MTDLKVGPIRRTKKVEVNDKKINLPHGTCKSSNICYLAKWSICKKSYTSRTIDPLHVRINGHRSIYKEVLKRSSENTLEELSTDKDTYTLGLHLHLEHGVDDPNGFDNLMKFELLEKVNPTDIEKKEYQWMHQVNTFQPVGINVEYPFGIPYLGQK